MKKTEIFGLIFTLIGLLFLMYDVDLSVNWTIYSFIGLGLLIPGIILLIRNEFYNKS